ncbi:MAG: hypothetical protein ACI9SQ_001916 [Rubritalea sp.]|jgi:hypothetical protein
MKAFFKLTLASICLTIASCTTAQLYYKPHTSSPGNTWEGSSSSWGGYKETSASNGQFNIEYTAFNKPSREAVSYFTMLRAAERTLIQGRTHFYITQSMTLRSKSEESYFPAYVIPGRWVFERVKHHTICPETGEKEYHYDDERVWYPERYFPERYVTNYIHKSKMRIALNRGGKKYSAIEIATNALNDTGGFGKPKLDPRAQAMLKNIVF